MPAKLLKVIVTLGSVTKYISINPVAWRTTLQVDPQPHSDFISDTDGYYKGRDVKVGDYFTTTNGGKVLKITNIVSASDETVVCDAEDENQINAKLDPNQGMESRIPNGSGLLFEVKNGLPVLYPLPDALSGTFDETFAAQLISRFQSFITNTIPDNVLTSALFDVANGIPQLNSNSKLEAVKIANLSKSSVGLNNVDNTSDSNKPISVLVQAALNDKLDTSLRGSANGVAPLDGSGKIPTSIIPGGSLIIVVADITSLPNTGETGKFYVVTSQDEVYIWSGTKYVNLASTGGGSVSEDTYDYIAVGANSTLTNKQVVSLLADNLVLSIPSTPDNGEEIIILNSSGYSFTLTTGIENTKATINGSLNDFYAADGQHRSLYLVYINDWKVNDSAQSININTAAEAKSTDYYWPGNTIHEIREELVYGGKQSFIESWKNTIGTILAEQITIFDNYATSDDHRQIWFPREGTALEKRVVFSPLSLIDLPAVSYFDNLVFSLVRMLNINWRSYETFEQMINIPTNFFNIINDQQVINLISANSEFLHEFTESIQEKRLYLPVKPMTANNLPIDGYGAIITSSTDNPTYAWRAFDNDPETYWESITGQVVDQKITFKFTGKTLFPHTINIKTSDSAKCPRKVRLQYKPDEVWETVGEFILDNSQTYHTFKITKAGISSDIWRFVFVDNWGGDTIRVNELQLIGWNINLMM